jgi:hypothetical protein
MMSKVIGFFFLRQDAFNLPDFPSDIFKDI